MREPAIDEKQHNNLPPVMTVKDVQGFLQIGRTRAYELFQIAEDPPPHIRIGRSIRVPRDAFLEWFIERQKFFRGKTCAIV